MTDNCGICHRLARKRGVWHSQINEKCDLSHSQETVGFVTDWLGEVGFAVDWLGEGGFVTGWLGEVGFVIDWLIFKETQDLLLTD